MRWKRTTAHLGFAALVVMAAAAEKRPARAPVSVHGRAEMSAFTLLIAVLTLGVCWSIGMVDAGQVPATNALTVARRRPTLGPCGLIVYAPTAAGTMKVSA